VTLTEPIALSRGLHGAVHDYSLRGRCLAIDGFVDPLKRNRFVTGTLQDQPVVPSSIV
jgi:hypothetical protein